MEPSVEEHEAPPIVSLDKQVIPRQYMGKKIEKDFALELMATKTKGRGQVPGLIYLKEQLPTKKKDRGWEHVIRTPKHEKTHIITSDYGEDKKRVIYVHYQKETNVPSALEEGVKGYIKSFRQTRGQEGEEGVLIAHGSVIDYRSREARQFRPIGGANMSSNMMRAYHEALNTIIRKSNCAVLLEEVVSQSLDDVIKCGKSKFLARGGCSESLSNSPHTDPSDDSPSFAVFFRQSGNKDARTWFLFPTISLAIELSERPCVISWDGRVERHCSRTMANGIFSGCAWRNRFVQQHYAAKHAFDCIDHNKNLKIREKVRVRKRVNGKKKKWRNIDATVLRLHKETVEVAFHNGSTEEVLRHDVVKSSIVNKLMER